MRCKQVPQGDLKEGGFIPGSWEKYTSMSEDGEYGWGDFETLLDYYMG
jgi:hypothetical protein